MSRPSFRPRPIDLTKPLPIIKSSKDLRNEDDVVVNRALPAVATGVDPSEEGERHLRQALLASMYDDDKKPSTANIPVPVVHVVTSPSSKACFKRPVEYIMFDKSDEDLEQEAVDYDADHVDEAFAKQIVLDMDLFEKVMDVMEKIQGRGENTPDGLASFTAVKSALTEFKLPDDKKKEMYAHWHKRRLKNGKPFLRIYQTPPDPSNNDPSVAFRPRDKEGGGGRRMNTYENFKRARMLREELIMLRRLLDDVVQREMVKKGVVDVRLLKQRVKVGVEGGQRMEGVNRSVFSGEVERIVTVAGAVVPVGRLQVPEGIEVAMRRLADRKRSSVSRRRTPKPGTPRREERAAESTVDTFGFDEHGNRFLKHMRYFAGGFMNYGVSPYDHRVFAAASERNTVRVHPHSPPPVLFPGPNVKFGSMRDTNRSHRGAKIGKDHHLLTEDVARDIAGEPVHIQRRPRSYRARARVGRGGRIVLDRVIYEREQGVKAASYPASVEMGGVYTGGLPLSAASNVAKSAPRGDMGEVALLASDSPLAVLHPAPQKPAEWPKKRRRLDSTTPQSQQLRSLPAYGPRRLPVIEQVVN